MKISEKFNSNNNHLITKLIKDLRDDELKLRTSLWTQ